MTIPGQEDMVFLVYRNGGDEGDEMQAFFDSVNALDWARMVRGRMYSVDLRKPFADLSDDRCMETTNSWARCSRRSGHDNIHVSFDRDQVNWFGDFIISAEQMQLAVDEWRELGSRV